MTSTIEPTPQDAREILESVISEAADACRCGRPMVVGTHGADLWIECETLRGKSGLGLALASSFHDWRAIGLPETLQAAA